MYHYVNTFSHPHKRDIATKYGVADTGAPCTYIRPDNPHENSQKLGHKMFVSSSCGYKLSSITYLTLSLPKLLDKVRENNLLPGRSHRSIISIGKLCDAVCKSIFDEQSVNITRKVISILKGWRYHQTGLWILPLHKQQT